MKFFVSIILSLFIAGCFYSPAKEVTNICELLDDNISWYHALKKTEVKYRVPMHLTLAIIHQESRFESHARPPREYYFGFIPGERSSSAYGYSQATTDTWEWYKLKSANNLAKRTNFADSVDFISWYVDKSYVLVNISKSDTYKQYLAYHEGHNGYKNKTYKNKEWLINVARKVNKKANIYKKQLSKCRVELDKRKVWLIF